MKRMFVMLVSMCIILIGSNKIAFPQHGHVGQGMDSHGGMGMPRDTVGSGHSGNTASQKMGRDQDEALGKLPVGDRLAHTPQLSSKLKGLLPPGTNLQDASKGFKNLGQFVAAVHVAHNLNIPFDQLKAKMTGPSAVSLGKAIHELQPNAKAKAEAKEAEKEASQDLREAKEAEADTK